MNANRLTDKIAIVTGGGRGIGYCEALALAREGAQIVISDFGRNEDGQVLAAIAAEEINHAGGQAVGVAEDLATTSGARRTVEAALDTFGGLDILVNNAGMRAGNPVHKMTDDQWELVISSHLKASFLMIRACVPLLRQRGGGSIVNTGSEAGLGMVFNPAYAAAKEGLAGLTRSVARETGRFGIRCNLIRPRATAGKTGGGDWFQQNLAGTWRPLLEALGRYWIGERGTSGWDRKAPPHSIGAFVAWLCSPAAVHLNGQDFFVGGHEIALISQPQFHRTLYREEGWTIDALDAMASDITGDLVDHFRVANPFENDD
ncbi:Short-chain dehydrogenase [Hyphomicrobiales bacterium]|nr:Short-chain dehydrogenase [Hyphomicrobiales bacterium]